LKVAFPTQEDRGLESRVHGHFGSASHFIVVEAESGDCETVVNRNQEHLHGQCQPLSALGGQALDAVVVGGIGGGALVKLNAAGIKVYRAVEGSIRENLALVRSGRLPELTLDQTCAGHDADGNCGH
jgi:predicted Fe-Mo cluster-binding NifX family protein